MTDLNAVAMLVQVVDLGSFSRAAAQMNMPVSTVSRKIAELEQSLDVRLLERTTRRLRLTEIGHEYLALCRRGLGDLTAAQALVTDRQQQLTGRLRISVPPTMSDLVVLPLVSRFRERHPGVVVNCLVTERHVDHIADGVDLSLRVGDLADSSVVCVTVSQHRPRLVASPRYLASLGHETLEPADLADHVQVAFSRWERPLLWRLQRDDQWLEIKPAPWLVVNDYAAVLRAVLDGCGISELPSFIAAAALSNAELVEPLAPWRFGVTKVVIAYPSNRHLSPLTRAFSAFCKDYFSRHPLAPE